MAKRFITPFAEAGDRAEISNEPIGSDVNMQTGYPAEYEADPVSDPNARFVERDKTNQIFNDITANIKEWQENTYPAFITAANNGGTAFAYKKGDRVSYNGDNYESLEDNNQDAPTTSKWVISRPTDVIKAMLIAQGLSGNYGFFEKGFDYLSVGDVGVSADGKIYTYVGAAALPVTVAAGTNPAGGADYERVVDKSKIIDFSAMAEAVSSTDPLKIFDGAVLQVADRANSIFRVESSLTGPTADGRAVVASSVFSLVFVLDYEDHVITSQLGSTLTEELVQYAIDLGTANVFVSPGEWVFSAPIILRNNLKLSFSPQSMVTPASDGISLIETPVGSYVANGVTTENCTVHGFRFKMDGVSNCYGVRVGNLRDNAGFFNAFGANDLNAVGQMDDRNNVGISYEILCWNTDLQDCYMRSGFHKGYEIRNGSNSIIILNCRSNTHTTGLFIADGEYATENTVISGGLFQRGVVNIDDRATHTVYNGPYIERPSVCDIDMVGASFPVINAAHFTGGEDAPSCAIRGRNVRGAQFKGVLSTASRTNGTYDFDASNSFCFAEQQRSETLGTVLGDVTGLKMKQNWISSDAKEGDIGMLNNLMVGRQNAITVRLANNYNSVFLMPDFVINISSGFGIFKKNISGDAAFTITGSPVDGQSFRLVLFTAANISTNAITVNGLPVDTSSATGGAKACVVEYSYISDLSRWVSGSHEWIASL